MLEDTDGVEVSSEPDSRYPQCNSIQRGRTQTALDVSLGELALAGLRWRMIALTVFTKMPCQATEKIFRRRRCGIDVHITVDFKRHMLRISDCLPSTQSDISRK